MSGFPLGHPVRKSGHAMKPAWILLPLVIGLANGQEMLQPTATQPGTKEENGIVTTLVVIASVTGHPAMSVPMGFALSGLPLGMQMIGRPFGEATMFQIGAAFESSFLASAAETQSAPKLAGRETSASA